MTVNKWSNQDWEEAQAWESKWHGGFNGACSNSYAEEVKHLTYAYKMGLTAVSGEGQWPCYDLGGASVLDIGGGPVSILLKCFNTGQCRVADPCEFPSWVHGRYFASGIEFVSIKGEDLADWSPQWDEAWIYNVLQHTQDPELIIMNARKLASTIRIIEWIDIPPHQGHPQELKEADLNKWLGGTGTTEWLSENGCTGVRAYYGVFKY